MAKSYNQYIKRLKRRHNIESTYGEPMKYTYQIESIFLTSAQKTKIHIGAYKGEIEMKSGFVESIDQIPTMIKEMEQE